MQIGFVAQKVGLSVDAIRFYERNGLLPRAARTQGGFRQFGERDVETLAFIRRVQGLGFKLTEIRGLLTLAETGYNPVLQCVAGCRQNWTTFEGNSRTSRNLSMNFSWPCTVATRSCA